MDDLKITNSDQNTEVNQIPSAANQKEDFKNNNDSNF